MDDVNRQVPGLVRHAFPFILALAALSVIPAAAQAGPAAATPSFSVAEISSLGGDPKFMLASGINDSGQVTGSSSLADNATTHAFLYNHGTFFDLNDLIAASPLAPYVTLFEATAITDTGYILAEGVDSRNDDAWFVLHRNPARAATIPPYTTRSGWLAHRFLSVSQPTVSTQGAAHASSAAARSSMAVPTLLNTVIASSPARAKRPLGRSDNSARMADASMTPRAMAPMISPDSASAPARVST